MVRSDLAQAWNWREKAGILKKNGAVRVFHGPGEGNGVLQDIALDRFGDHYWLTEWEVSPNRNGSRAESSVRDEVVMFLKGKGAKSIVGLSRPEKGVASECCTHWGTPPAGRFQVEEIVGKYWIQFENTRHPGLFLDHEPLRRWLVERATGWQVLNTFAYTGSLSVAAALGGASQVTTLDLSRPSVKWAQDNFELNNLLLGAHRFIVGDVFEWLPRLKRENKRFDCIILDPPSFSHAKKGKFSTAKDLERLHRLALDLLNPGGYFITSINSSNLSWNKFETDVLRAAEFKKMRFSVVRTIDLPETFPTPFGRSERRYLKGWILRNTSR